MRNPRVVSVIAASRGRADGVRDHAQELTRELGRHGCDADVLTVDWRSEGWRTTHSLAREAQLLRPDLIILHYSHVAWSRRGLPVGLLDFLWRLRRASDILLWVHDPGRVDGDSVLQRAGSYAKSVGLNAARHVAEGVVVTVHPSRVYWLGACPDNVGYMPSPSNLPRVFRQPPAQLTLSCFGIGVTSRAAEICQLFDAAVAVADLVGPLTVRILGDNSLLADSAVAALADANVTVDVPGLQSPLQVATLLAASHIFIHLRGFLTTRSGSLAAALAAGLPVVARRGEETGPPLTDAGVLLFRDTDSEGLASAVLALASDVALQDAFSNKNLEISNTFYSWSRAAELVLAALDRRPLRTALR
jgi:glycosyltransferase involved in cell wall biosynthesis